jgi:hypothetical protein
VRILLWGFPGSGSGLAGGRFVEDGQQREEVVLREAFVVAAGTVEDAPVF